MEKEEYQRLYEFEDFYWWHVGRREIVKSLLLRIPLNKNSHILDVGCGTGGNLEILSKFGEVIGLDRSKDAIEFSHRKGFKNCIVGEAENINYPNESFELIAALDLLEHIDDEQKALREFHRVLKKEGYLLIMVPAYQFLWSEHDDVLFHKRRYTLSGLNSIIKKANFEIVWKSYFITFTAPVFFIYRSSQRIFRKKDKKREKKKSDYIVLPNFLNKFLIYILKIEAYLAKYVTFPFGVSIALIAKKLDKTYNK